MNPVVSFLADVSNHLSVFAKSKGVKGEDVHIRVILADGTSITIRGLETTAPSVAQGFGMIEGAVGSTEDAWVVREAHVLRVEFGLMPEERRPIGLHTEISKP